MKHTDARNIFDNPETKLTRTLSASWLDSHIDSEKEFNRLLLQMKEIGKIIIINDRPKCMNPIYREYSEEMLRSYIKAFQEKGLECMWMES